MLYQPNITQLEKNLQRAKQFARQPRYDAIEIISHLYSPNKCKTEFLPWLAWAVSVPNWNDSWGENAKREMIKEAFFINSHLGTIGSIRRVLRIAGFGDAEITEGYGELNNSVMLENDWATYRIKLEKPITTTQAKDLIKILKMTAPARSELLNLDFTEVANIWDGKLRFDGSYTYGGNI